MAVLSAVTRKNAALLLAIVLHLPVKLLPVGLLPVGYKPKIIKDRMCLGWFKIITRPNIFLFNKPTEHKDWLKAKKGLTGKCLDLQKSDRENVDRQMDIMAFNNSLAAGVLLYIHYTYMYTEWPARRVYTFRYCTMHRGYATTWPHQ